MGHTCFSNNICCAEDRPVGRRLGFVTAWADRTVCFLSWDTAEKAEYQLLPWGALFRFPSGSWLYVQGIWEQRVCPSSWAFGMGVPQYPLTNRSRRGKSQLSDSLKAVEPDTFRAGDKGYLCLAGGFFCLSTFVLVQVEDQPEV